MTGDAQIRTVADLDVDPEEAPRAALNQVADAWPDGVLEPENIDMTLATEIGYRIQSQSEELIDSLESNTELSHRESQVWVLSRMVPANDEPLMHKSIGLYFVLMDDADDFISPQAIQSYSDRIDDKVASARETLLWLSRPHHQDTLDNPSLLWLEDSTINRLRERVRRPQGSFDDLIHDLLDQTQETISLRELAELYRDEYGAVQVAIEKQSVELGKLMFVVHLGQIPEELPSRVQQADAVTVGDTAFPFQLDHSRMGPQGSFRYTVYAGPNIVGMDPVSIDEGISTVRKAVETASE